MSEEAASLDPTKIIVLQREIDRRIAEKERAKPIDGGGGGPQDPTMEQRVATLEGDVKDIKASLGRLEASNARIEAAVMKIGDALVKTREDMAELKGRISQLPGSIQIVSIILAVNAAAIALGGLTITVLRALKIL